MTDDFQREMEQRALKNVRGLVDKIEKDDKLEAHKQRRVLYWIFGVAVVVAVLAGLFIAMRPNKATEVVIDPARLPPVKAGPQR